MSEDKLRSVRSLHYMGLVQQAVKESNSIAASNPALASLCDFYKYRTLIAAGKHDAVPSIDMKAPAYLHAAKSLSAYQQSEDGRELVLEGLEDMVARNMLADPSPVELIASDIFIREKKLKEALKLVVNAGENLEKLAVSVILYLKIDRPDLALKIVKVMQDVDDDDALTQLATAWAYIAQGGEKVTEASFVLQELLDKYGKSVPVNAALGACQLHMKNHAKALEYLKAARDQAVADQLPVSAETLVNTIVCLQHLRKPADIIQKYMSELQQLYPSNAWLKRYTDAEAAFDKYAATYA